MKIKITDDDGNELKIRDCNLIIDKDGNIVHISGNKKRQVYVKNKNTDRLVEDLLLDKTYNREFGYTSSLIDVLVSYFCEHEMDKDDRVCKKCKRYIFEGK